MPFRPPSGGGGLDQLTGDVTAGPGTGSQAATLAAVGTAETVGDATHYPVVTTVAKGRVTGMVATAVPAGVNPATTVIGPDAFGAAAAVGVGTEYARDDHNHGLPAAPADVPLATVTTAGDLIVATGAGAVTRLPVGSSSEALLGGSTPGWWTPPDPTKVPLAGGTMTGQRVVPALEVSGLTGATAASRYVGATTGGAPVSGTFAVGDFVIDQSGTVWICTTAGTPGTWVKPGGAPGTTLSAYLGADLGSGASTATNVVSLSLVAGTWLVRGNVAYASTSVANVVGYAGVGPHKAPHDGARALAHDARRGPAGGGNVDSMSVEGLITLAATTTVYLEFQANYAGAIKYQGDSSYFANKLTGMIALRTA